MCINCWEEQGSPCIINKKTIKGAKLVDELYETEDGGVGGYGHSVFDDWNLEGDFKFHFDWAATDKIEGKDVEPMCKKTKIASVKALEFFKTLTIPERYSALAIHDGFISIK